MAQRILIVDDNQMICEILEFFLTKEGYSVDTAAGVAEALESIDLYEYHIMVFDKNMPGINGNVEGGFDLLRYVRSKSLPSAVIMMSGNPGAASTAEALKLGANCFIQKPFSLEYINQRIKQILHYQAGQKQLLLSGEIQEARFDYQDMEIPGKSGIGVTEDEPTNL